MDSQWRLIWLKFTDHKLALWSGVFILLVYLMGIFVRDEGGLHFQPHVTGFSQSRDPNTLRMVFAPDPEARVPLGLFVRGAETYRLFGLIKTDRHLFGPKDPAQPFYLMGADRLGRDVFSRLVYGTRISTSIGLVGVAISLVLGVALGGISGYFGGWIDTAVQRVTEFIISIPTIPLWMGLAAAIPVTWSPILVYFIITVIISLSFLGIGLRPPVVSWGVLLKEAQNIRSLSEAPWLLAPGVMVIMTVLALNCLGDGLRHAADPYAE
nr:ABC transporter permease [Mesobacterium pallidum]